MSTVTIVDAPVRSPPGQRRTDKGSSHMTDRAEDQTGSDTGVGASPHPGDQDGQPFAGPDHSQAAYAGPYPAIEREPAPRDPVTPAAAAPMPGLNSATLDHSAGASAGADADRHPFDRATAGSGLAATGPQPDRSHDSGPELDRPHDTGRPENRGSTILADEVVEKIAGIAAREVPGVYDLGGDVARVFSSVKERLGFGQNEGDQGVSVRLDGTTAAVRVTLVIEYGYVVYAVADKVRSNVIGAVEDLLGLEVTAVDIVVDDIHVPDDDEPA
jgi:uncharacterized alkaline shock family protein YloU